MDSGESSAEIGNKIASFSKNLILGSSSDAHCQNHSSFDPSCDSCKSIKLRVEKYQTHRHRFTCYKKRKIINIAEGEGHGRHDGKKRGEAISVRVCRFSFPKFPLDTSEYILSFPEDTDKKIVKNAKMDHAKIKKYLLRLTHFDHFELSQEWKTFLDKSAAAMG